MSEPRPDSGLPELVRVLREAPAELDQVTAARMERAVVQGWRARAAAHVPLHSFRGAREGGSVRSSRRATFSASLALAAAAGGLVAYFGATAHEGTLNAAVAQFELRVGDLAVQRGALAEGQVLESGELGDIQVDLGTARIEMARGARLRFDRLSPDRLSISLARGRIDIDFHPARRGEQQLVVDSRAAQVLVIGTRFSVEVDALGNTEVYVREGVVEVRPHSGGPVERVTAGHRAYVRADEGDATERAVRASIEERLEELPPEPSAETVSDPLAEAELADDDGLSADSLIAISQSNAAIARRLESARVLLRQGRHVAARARLRGLSSRNVELRFRVEALTLIAESHTAQGDVALATAAYEKAAEIGAHGPQGDNAQFALARLLERYTQDRSAATQAYARYLERAPEGALAMQARVALCRLGDAAHCR